MCEREREREGEDILGGREAIFSASCVLFRWQFFAQEILQRAEKMLSARTPRKFHVKRLDHVLLVLLLTASLFVRGKIKALTFRVRKKLRNIFLDSI